MDCRVQLGFVYGMMLLAGLLLLGAIASAIVAIALNGIWVTAVFGGALTAIIISNLLSALAATAALSLIFALAQYQACISCSPGVCGEPSNRLLGIILTILTLFSANLYAGYRLSEGLALIPGLAIPPLIAILVILGLISGFAILLGMAWADYENCLNLTCGSVTIRMPITTPGAGGGGGGHGGGGPPIMGLRPDRPRELYDALSHGKWFRQWPSGTIIDGSLGPDVCPICLYTLVVAGEISGLDIGSDGRIQNLHFTGVELVTVDASGKSLPLPLRYIAVERGTQTPLLPGLVVQGLVTKDDVLCGVIAGEAPFDFEPYLDRRVK